MEESLSLLNKIKKEFELEEVDINTYSPLTLAFIGDCIFDLVIRTALVLSANRQTQKLHKDKSGIVKAKSQADMIDAISGELRDTEESWYRRGRNAKSYSVAKNASVNDYRKATGFETLMGYLYITGQDDRMMELIKKALTLCGYIDVIDKDNGEKL